MFNQALVYQLKTLSCLDELGHKQQQPNSTISKHSAISAELFESLYIGIGLGMVWIADKSPPYFIGFCCSSDLGYFSGGCVDVGGGGESPAIFPVAVGMGLCRGKTSFLGADVRNCVEQPCRDAINVTTSCAMIVGDSCSL